MKRYILSPGAAHDLDLIKAYLLEEAGVHITRTVTRRFRAAMETLSRQPGLGHFRDDLAPHTVKFWSLPPYLIIYDPATRPLEIVRILHGSRDVSEILKE